MIAMRVLGVSGFLAILFLLYCFREFRREARKFRRRSLERTRRNSFAILASASAQHSGDAAKRRKKSVKAKALAAALGFVVPTVLAGQTNSANSTPPTAPPAVPLATPAMVGPLVTASPKQISAGPFGKLDLTGTLSGFGLSQSHSSASDRTGRGDISNAQIFLQKPDGVLQFYLQAGAYNIPALGTASISTQKTMGDFFGPLPVAYFKFAPGNNLSLLVGKLPTLIGAEDTFSFQNLNIERGLLWNQENAINRGIQVNASKGRLSASLSWNDGYYSNRYNWLTGALTATVNSANSLEFVAGGNLGQTDYANTATPIDQNNSSIYDLLYTHTAKRWMVEPYLQYSAVPQNTRISVGRTTTSLGGAMLGDYSFTAHLTLTGRAEYIATSGSRSDGAANLLYGPGSDAWSVTLTPTYQKSAFFTRGEFSFTQAAQTTSGDAFGASGTRSSQARGLIEVGFLF